MFFFCWPEINADQVRQNNNNALAWKEEEEEVPEAMASPSSVQVSAAVETALEASGFQDASEEDSLYDLVLYEEQSAESMPCARSSPSRISTTTKYTCNTVQQETPFDDNHSSSSSWEPIVPEASGMEEEDRNSLTDWDATNKRKKRRLTKSHALLCMVIVVGVCLAMRILLVPADPRTLDSQEPPEEHPEEKFVWLSWDDDVAVQEFYDPPSPPSEDAKPVKSWSDILADALVQYSSQNPMPAKKKPRKILHSHSAAPPLTIQQGPSRNGTKVCILEQSYIFGVVPET